MWSKAVITTVCLVILASSTATAVYVTTIPPPPPDVTTRPPPPPDVTTIPPPPPDVTTRPPPPPDVTTRPPPPPDVTTSEPPPPDVTTRPPPPPDVTTRPPPPPDVTTRPPPPPDVTTSEPPLVNVTTSQPPLDECEDGKACICRLTGNITIINQHRQLEKARSKMEDIEDNIKDLDLSYVILELEKSLKRVSELESKVADQAIETSIREILDIQHDADQLVDHIHDIENNGTLQENIEEMKRELQQVADILDDIWELNPYAENERLSLEIEELQAKVAGCSDWSNSTFFRGDALPLVPPGEEDWCDRYEVDGFGAAFTHVWLSSHSGPVAWFKDPLPTHLTNRTQIYSQARATSYPDVNRVEKYQDFITWSNWQTMHDPSRISGAGIQAYNGSLFYAYDEHLYRYHVASQSLQYKDITYSTQEYFQNDYDTHVDFKHDETGLYSVVAHTDNNNKLVIRKHDAINLATRGTWNTNRLKSSVCAVFMICGKLYTLDNCKSRLLPGDLHKQYVYDTVTGSDSHEAYGIPATFGHIFTLAYNARERVLFGWDNGHAVTYPVFWKRKSNPS